MQDEKIKELDSLSAIAMLMVLVWHYAGDPDGPTHWLWKTLHVGRFGVYLFFLLSGYLITSILLKNRTSETYYLAFYGRRIFRIWPIFYLTCAISFVGWLS